MDSGNTCEKCGTAIDTNQCPLCGKHLPCCEHAPRVQPTSIIEEGVALGPGVVVWDWCKVRRGAKLGAYCVVGDYVEIGPGVTIGAGTHIGAGAQLHSPARIGARVHILPRVFLSNDRYPDLCSDFVPQGVVIGDDAVVCEDVSIVGGVKVGAGAVLCMKALVVKDVPPGAIVRGEGTAAVVKGRRAEHWPGTAMQHWGPLQPGKHCRRCADAGLEQYDEWMAERQRAKNDGDNDACQEDQGAGSAR